MRNLCALVLIIIVSLTSFAELRGQLPNFTGGSILSQRTAVSSLSITPDATGMALGWEGVSTKPDMNSQHYNVAKYSFTEDTLGLSISYVPWLRSLLPDIRLVYLPVYYKIDEKNTVSGSVRYFSLGNITFSSSQGTVLTQLHPFEMVFDLGYSRLISDHLSLGITVRYIHSKIFLEYNTGGTESKKPGIAFAGDLGLYYEKALSIKALGGEYAWGISLTNLGPHITYPAVEGSLPLPTDLKIGSRVQFDLNSSNDISINLEFNKLLVPTDPVRDVETDSIIRGMEPPSSAVLGMIRSFSDAPGILFSDGTVSSVFREELTEIRSKIGIEYSYNETFFYRMGYHHQHVLKGGIQFLSFGVGYRRRFFSVDAAYLQTFRPESPIANTVCLSLGVCLK